MRALVLGISLLTPWLALGQTTTFEIKLRQAVDTVVVGPNDCGSTVPATWSRPTISCGEIRFWLVNSSTSCPNSPDTTDLILEEVPANDARVQGAFEIDVDTQIPLFASDGGTACGTLGLDSTFKLCGVYNVQNVSTLNCDQPVKDGTPPTLRYDSKAPTTPQITSVEALDSSLSVNLEVDDDTDTVELTVLDPGGAASGRVTPYRGGNVQVDGLENGVEYTITAVAVDVVGNKSEPSTESKGTPVATAGFYRNYLDANGSETGGCSATSAGALAGMGLVAALIALRRRRS